MRERETEQSVRVMVLTPAGLALIKEWEDLRLSAYQDQAGVWTVGWGHTRGVTHATHCTMQQADTWLRQDISWAHAGVANAVSGNTSNEQFSAMISLCFNIGIPAFRTSTVLRQHRAGLLMDAANAFLLFDKVHIDGQLVTSTGLLDRRNSERNMYLGEDGDAGLTTAA